MNNIICYVFISKKSAIIVFNICEINSICLNTYHIIRKSERMTDLLKFKVMDEILVISKALLTAKSNYFETLLNGPFALAMNAEGFLTLREQDVATFKNHAREIR